jgi:23S rRNA pseudouridine2605 synthase
MINENEPTPNSTEPVIDQASVPRKPRRKAAPAPELVTGAGGGEPATDLVPVAVKKTRIKRAISVASAPDLSPQIDVTASSTMSADATSESTAERPKMVRKPSVRKVKNDGEIAASTAPLTNEVNSPVRAEVTAEVRTDVRTDVRTEVLTEASNAVSNEVSAASNGDQPRRENQRDRGDREGRRERGGRQRGGRNGAARAAPMFDENGQPIVPTGVHADGIQPSGSGEQRERRPRDGAQQRGGPQRDGLQRDGQQGGRQRGNSARGERSASQPPEEAIPFFSESGRVGGRQPAKPVRDAVEVPDEDFDEFNADEDEGEPGRGQRPARAPRRSLVNLGEEASKLHKILADAGLGSRREMEDLIIAGRVSVNGQPAHVGQRTGPNDLIKVNGRPIRLRAQSAPIRVAIYHKPAGEIVTRDDPGNRPVVFDKLPRPKGARWVAVGRLDINTEGLLIFTTSGDLANKLMHPRYGWEREYAVRILGRVNEDGKQRLLSGVELEDGPAAFSAIEEVGGAGSGGDGANCWYRVVISEGRNREVRRMFEAIGLTVSRLVRVRFGPVALPPMLKRGRWVELASGDLETLDQCMAEFGVPDSERAADSDEDFDQDAYDTDDDPVDDSIGNVAVPEVAENYDPRLHDDEWQPNSANAHQEAITKNVRKRPEGTQSRSAQRRTGRGGAGGVPFSSPSDGLGGAGGSAGGLGGGLGGGRNRNAGRNKKRPGQPHEAGFGAGGQAGLGGGGPGGRNRSNRGGGVDGNNAGNRDGNRDGNRNGNRGTGRGGNENGAGRGQGAQPGQRSSFVPGSGASPNNRGRPRVPGAEGVPQTDADGQGQRNRRRRGSGGGSGQGQQGRPPRDANRGETSHGAEQQFTSQTVAVEGGEAGGAQTRNNPNRRRRR